MLHTPFGQENEAGREIITKLREEAKENNFKRLVTLSPLTPIPTHLHKNAKQVHINEETQNFEYADLPKSKKYRVIYADLCYLKRGQIAKDRSPEKHYPVLSLMTFVIYLSNDIAKPDSSS